MSKKFSDRIYKIIYFIFLPLIRHIGFVKYGIKPHRYKFDEPVLILSNHTTDMDFTTISASFVNHYYIVCSRHVFGMGLGGKLLKFIFNPIGVFKGGLKPSEVMEMIRRVKRGNNLLLYCEGRLSHNGKTVDIDFSTAKLVKKLGCKLVTFKTTGGFFKQPRWQCYMNKGNLFSADIVNTYDKEYLKNASVEEIYEHIKEDLYTDAYEEQKKYMRPFKLKNGARDITRYYDTCPNCRQIDTLHVEDKKIICSCGYTMEYDDYGYLHGEPQLVSTVQDWEKIQNEIYESRFEKGEFFSDEGVALSELDENFKGTLLAEGTLVSDAEKYTLGEYSFPYDKIGVPEILKGGSTVVFSYDGGHFMLTKMGACLNKYVELYKWSRKQS